MAKVFVSHAAADEKFVGSFVDTVLRIGLGLNGDTIFYSSARDTGVPSGADLMNHIRKEVYRSLNNEPVAYPDRFESPSLADAFNDALDRKLLTPAREDGWYEPNLGKQQVKDARDAVDRLQVLLESEDGYESFQDAYPNLDPDISDLATWEALLQ